MSSGNSGDEGTARIARLRDEIERVLEREYAFAVKYRALAASFEALMTDPNQRHDAVLLALSATMKREVREIGTAVTSQQEELALLEQAVGELFEKLGAKGGGQGTSAEARIQQGAVPPRHCSKCGEPLSLDRYEDRWKCRSCSHEVEQGNNAARGREREKPAVAAAEHELQKKCSQCGGVMHFHGHHERWQCYTCAHEETISESGQAGSGETAGQRSKAPDASNAGPVADIIPGKVALSGTWTYQKPAAKTRVCPVCRKKMDWSEQEKRWKCFFCGHKTK